MLDHTELEKTVQIFKKKNYCKTLNLLIQRLLCKLFHL